MDFRSHLARPLDVKSPWNVVVGVLTLITAGIAAVLWLNGQPGDVALAPVYTFLIWALTREIDPDHHWTALAAAIVTAVWALTGGAVASGFALAGLLVATRIVTSTTGRRPLPLDLAGVTVFGIAIGFTVEGWTAGFGIALAVYLDDRFSEESRLMGVGAAAATAVGTTVVATLANAFPERLPDIDQGMAITAGVAALLLLMREPAQPLSQVDARHAAFIDKARLHSSRSMLGVLVFLMAILTGVDAVGLIVVIAAIALAVVSNEVELIRRRNL